ALCHLHVRHARPPPFPSPTLFRSDGPAPRHSIDFRLPPRTDSRKSTWSQTSERTTEASMPAETSHHLPVTIRVAATEADLRQVRSEEHTSELQSRENLVCRLLLEK